MSGRKAPNPKPRCWACYHAGFPERVYMSHTTFKGHPSKGIIQCKYVLSQTCAYCGEKGHTEHYCPKKPRVRKTPAKKSAPVAVEKPTPAPAPTKMFCPVCKAAGKTEAEYTSHYVRDTPGGVVVCPTILNQTCKLCKEKGHNAKHCPHAKEQPARSHEQFQPALTKKQKRARRAAAHNAKRAPQTQAKPAKTKEFVPQSVFLKLSAEQRRDVLFPTMKQARDGEDYDSDDEVKPTKAKLDAWSYVVTAPPKKPAKKPAMATLRVKNAEAKPMPATPTPTEEPQPQPVVQELPPSPPKPTSSPTTDEKLEVLIAQMAKLKAELKEPVSQVFEALTSPPTPPPPAPIRIKTVDVGHHGEMEYDEEEGDDESYYSEEGVTYAYDQNYDDYVDDDGYDSDEYWCNREL